MFFEHLLYFYERTAMENASNFFPVSLDDLCVVLLEDVRVVINGISFANDTIAVSLFVLDGNGLPLMSIGGKIKDMSKMQPGYTEYFVDLMKKRTVLLLTKKRVLEEISD